MDKLTTGSQNHLKTPRHHIIDQHVLPSWTWWIQRPNLLGEDCQLITFQRTIGGHMLASRRFHQCLEMKPVALHSDLQPLPPNSNHRSKAGKCAPLWRWWCPMKVKLSSGIWVLPGSWPVTCVKTQRGDPGEKCLMSISNKDCTPVFFLPVSQEHGWGHLQCWPCRSNPQRVKWMHLKEPEILNFTPLNLSKNPEQMSLFLYSGEKTWYFHLPWTKTWGNLDEWCREKETRDRELPEEMNFKRNPKHQKSQAALFSYSWPSSTFPCVKRMELSFWWRGTASLSGIN